MSAVKRSEIQSAWPGDASAIDKAEYVILRPNGTVYDYYPERDTAFRVLGDLQERYPDGGYYVSEVSSD